MINTRCHTHLHGRGVLVLWGLGRGVRKTHQRTIPTCVYVFVCVIVTCVVCFDMAFSCMRPGQKTRISKTLAVHQNFQIQVSN